MLHRHRPHRDAAQRTPRAPTASTTPAQDNSRRIGACARREPSSPAPGYVRIIRSFCFGGKQLQLSALPVLVEDLHGLLPTRIGRIVSAQRDNRACAVADHPPFEWSPPATSIRVPCHLYGCESFAGTCKQSVTLAVGKQGGRFSLHPIFERALLKGKDFLTNCPRNNSKWVAQ